MQFLTKLAFKNLWRHKLRTLVSIVAIAFSVMVVVFARGYILGMIDSFVSYSVQYNTGHIKIMTSEYWQKQSLLPLDSPVDGFDGKGVYEMAEELSNIDNVKAVIPRLKFGAMVPGEEEINALYAWGVVPEKEISNTDIQRLIKEGRMVKTGKREVVMGKTLLEKLGKKVGDKVTLVYNTSFNSMKGTTFSIVGEIDCGIALLNELVIYLPLDQAQLMLDMENQATELVIITGSLAESDKIIKNVKSYVDLKESDKKYSVLSYKETSEMLPWMELAKLIYNEIYIFIVLLASIVVINTMIMIVKERTKEIGMMTALGLTSREILGLFMLEGGILGGIGSFFGSLMGTLVSFYTNINGIDLSSAVGGFNKEIVFNAIIYPVNSIENSIFAFVLGTVIVTLSCIIPARMASKLEPTNALRDE